MHVGSFGQEIAMKIFLMKSFGRSDASGSEVCVILHDKHSPVERLKIALEQGKSACVFMDETISNSASFDLDFYYPHARSQLCLHAVLAASALFFESNIYSDKVTFRTALDQQHIVSRRQDNHIFLTVKKHKVPLISLDIGMVSSMLRIPLGYISEPPIVGSIGSPKLLVKIGSAEHLETMVPNLEDIVRWGQEKKISGCFVYHQINHNEFIGRNFNHLNPTYEDPATGVAAGALSTVLGKSLKLNQGDYLKNPCSIVANFLGESVEIGGRVSYCKN